MKERKEGERKERRKKGREKEKERKTKRKERKKTAGQKRKSSHKNTDSQHHAGETPLASSGLKQNENSHRQGRGKCG